MTPKVSIVILNYFHPEVIDVCLRQIAEHTSWMQNYSDYPYEVIVVNNGSDEEGEKELTKHVVEGRIHKLVDPGYNTMYSRGNNLGVAEAHPESEYLLFLNSDVAVIHDKWLEKIIDWMEGRAKHWPTVWGTKPTVPSDEPLDILSVGWSHDANIQPGMARPEGFCLMIRRNWWRNFDEDFPWYYGWEHTVALQIQAGAKCGLLCNYAPYLIHRECASGKAAEPIVNNGTPDLGAWFSGLPIETLNFTLGPDEHSSYLDW